MTEFERTIRAVTAIYRESKGLPPLASEIEIPTSIRTLDASHDGWPFRNRYCWECGSRENVDGFGRYALCGGCRASINQQYREQEAADRRYERDEHDDC